MTGGAVVGPSSKLLLLPELDHHALLPRILKPRDIHHCFGHLILGIAPALERPPLHRMHDLVRYFKEDLPSFWQRLNVLQVDSSEEVRSQGLSQFAPHSRQEDSVEPFICLLHNQQGFGLVKASTLVKCPDCVERKLNKQQL